ncbi:MAG: VacJ family lipoprotein [Magnetococcus sp. WYHC-3]
MLLTRKGHPAPLMALPPGRWMLVLALCLALWGGQSAQAVAETPVDEPPAMAPAAEVEDDAALFGHQNEARVSGEPVPDPLETWNRIWFVVNDRLYFWVFKPLGRGWEAVMPQPVRQSVDNVFDNLAAPVYTLNALLQGKGEQGLVEVERFFINSSLGALGLFDVAGDRFNLISDKEDFGQTLGHVGMGEGVYLVWPLLGPSNLRDTFGLLADRLANPLTYYPSDWESRVALQAGKWVNGVSLNLGRYEALKDVAVDPYFSLRDEFTRRRREAIAH